MQGWLSVLLHLIDFGELLLHMVSFFGFTPWSDFTQLYLGTFEETVQLNLGVEVIKGRNELLPVGIQRRLRPFILNRELDELFHRFQSVWGRFDLVRREVFVRSEGGRGVGLVVMLSFVGSIVAWRPRIGRSRNRFCRVARGLEGWDGFPVAIVLVVHYYEVV